MVDLYLDLSGLEVALSNLPESFAEKLRADWGPFVAATASDPVLRVRVSSGTTGEGAVPFDPHGITSRLGPGAGEFSLPGGEAEVDATGRARIEVASDDFEGYFNFLNLMVACLSVRLPVRGAALLHAACLVVDDRAYLLVGPSGAGKSTWARLGAGAGALALSDDMILIDGTDALASPFRPKELPGKNAPGRWPIGAILFPKQGARASRAATSRLLSQARLLANLPFIFGVAERDPAVKSVIDRLTSSVPCVELTFARDASFLPLLRPDEGNPA